MDNNEYTLLYLVMCIFLLLHKTPVYSKMNVEDYKTDAVMLT